MPALSRSQNGTGPIQIAQFTMYFDAHQIRHRDTATAVQGKYGLQIFDQFETCGPFNVCRIWSFAGLRLCNGCNSRCTTDRNGVRHCGIASAHPSFCVCQFMKQKQTATAATTEPAFCWHLHVAIAGVSPVITKRGVLKSRSDSRLFVFSAAAGGCANMLASECCHVGYAVAPRTCIRRQRINWGREITSYAPTRVWWPSARLHRS